MSDTENFPRTLRVGILVFDGFEPIDVWGFLEAFSISRFIGTSYFSPPPYPFEVVLIANQNRPDGGGMPEPVKSANGPRVAPDYFRDEALEKKIDLLMIPGGGGTRVLLSDERPEERRALLAWVRAMDERVEIMSSVCTGAAILAAAGVLDGKPATTNHAAFAWVTQFGPRVKWDNVLRWVDAGRYVTSAGVSAGIDMGFYLVKRLAGRAVAEVSAKGAEYGWHSNPETPIYYPQQAAVPNSR
ncbi:MAG TPA: DJ-1/PfpI family protein [Thermoanaerobaculia bacterium]|jgi:putative intracellular protease/amidase